MTPSTRPSHVGRKHRLPFNRGAPDRFYHSDAQGSRLAFSNSAGVVGARERYAPFGERLLNGAGMGNFITYTGHMRDADTGLTYMQARFYDPVIGRFLSTDPIGYQDQLNLYAYVHNDPVNKVDPTGEQALDQSAKFLDLARRHGGNTSSMTAEMNAGHKMGLAATGAIASIALPGPEDIVMGAAAAKMAGGALKGADAAKAGRGAEVGRTIDPNGSSKASDIVAKSKEVGFNPSQSANGPLKMVDENGVARVTIKSGSDRAAGSGNPHVELKDSKGQRVNPAGEPVARRSPENHTPIIEDRN